MWTSSLAMVSLCVLNFILICGSHITANAKTLLWIIIIYKNKKANLSVCFLCTATVSSGFGQVASLYLRDGHEGVCREIKQRMRPLGSSAIDARTECGVFLQRHLAMPPATIVSAAGELWPGSEATSCYYR